MLEILYRIYEVAADGEIVKNETFGIESISKVCNHEIAMDCTVCDSRDQFKQLMRECYGVILNLHITVNIRLVQCIVL